MYAKHIFQKVAGSVQISRLKGGQEAELVLCIASYNGDSATLEEAAKATCDRLDAMVAEQEDKVP